MRDAHSALTLPHPTREVRVLKRHGVGEGEGELRADFICQDTFVPPYLRRGAYTYWPLAISGVAPWAWPDAPKTFLNYNTRTGNFTDGHHSWNYKDEPVLY
jgi:hypothetical protein